MAWWASTRSSEGSAAVTSTSEVASLARALSGDIDFDPLTRPVTSRDAPGRERRQPLRRPCDDYRRIVTLEVPILRARNAQVAVPEEVRRPPIAATLVSTEEGRAIRDDVRQPPVAPVHDRHAEAAAAGVESAVP